MFVYVGAMTGQPGTADTPAALSVFDLDAASGRLQLVQTLADLHSPTYLAVHPHLPILYAAERHWPPMGPESPGTGSIATLAIDPADGHLTRAARQASPGAAHLNAHPSGRYLFAALNRAFQVGVFRIGEDGQVGELCSVVRHEGRGPKSPNQDRAFPHSTWMDPTGKRLLCCDLGIDRVMVYDFDAGTGQLQPSAYPFAQVSSGSGPRHLSIHPSGQFVYVLSELASTVAVFRYDAESSALSIVQTASLLPDGFDGESTAAQIIVHPSGRFLYASNRGHDSIVSFAIDERTGKLRLLGHEPSLGEQPHNFTIDRAGKLLLLVNRRSGNLVGFHINRVSGALTPTGHSENVESPACVVLAM